VCPLHTVILTAHLVILSEAKDLLRRRARRSLISAAHDSSEAQSTVEGACPT
jgi:hypothetical protein